MRIDKYLWCVRVFKTRTQATDACKENRVSIAGEPIKPSRDLKKGEEITVRKGAVNFSYKVIEFPKSRVGAALVADYVTETTTPEERLKLEMIKEGHNQRPRGLGRPTKRDRRDMDKFFR
jgi:ribosome-associated heat shock protein Hsp15